MTKPTILCSLLSDDKRPVVIAGRSLHNKGVDVLIHRWDASLNSLEKILSTVTAPHIALWCIAGKAKDISSTENQRMLSLTALGIKGKRGFDFPILVFPYNDIMPENLSEVLAGTETTYKDLCLQAVSKIFSKPTEVQQDWIVIPHVTPEQGFCLEIHPTKHTWNGAICGVSGLDKFGMPIKALSHALAFNNLFPQGLMSNPSFTADIPTEYGTFQACGVPNYVIPPNISYYIMLSGIPSSILFGEIPKDGKNNLILLNLQGNKENTGMAFSSAAPSRTAFKYIDKPQYRHVKRGAPSAGGNRRS